MTTKKRQLTVDTMHEPLSAAEAEGRDLVRTAYAVRATAAQDFEHARLTMRTCRAALLDAERGFHASIRDHARVVCGLTPYDIRGGERDDEAATLYAIQAAKRGDV